MSALVVIGSQWGDEGKGKLVDYLTSDADAVVRYQGGNNAGHTLVVDGKTTKLSLVPSGILRSDIVCLIGTGVVVDPHVLLAELDGLKSQGVSVSPERFILDRDAHLILEYHKALDQAKELSRGDSKIGTTGRGIGPAYADRASRCGIRFAELKDLDLLREKIKTNVDNANLHLEHLLSSSIRVSFDEVWATIEMSCKQLLPFVGNVSLKLDDLIRRDRKVVFEGAQGTLLDQMHGTIPFVTSSNTISGAATVGAGIGPGKIDYVLGVVKAYTTRVGSGPFPTELEDEVGKYLGKKGVEFGTVTGRSRRCGWFDAVSVKRSVRLNGTDVLALTKLDVLSGLDTIKVGINYFLDGEKLDDVPSLASELERVEVEYIELEGWKEDITKVKKWHHLPVAARFYVSTVAEIVGCPVAIVSVGPERDSTLFSNNADFIKNFYAKEE